MRFCRICPSSICSMRNISEGIDKRDPYSSKETHIHKRDPHSSKRDLQKRVWEVFPKKPTNEPYINQKRPTEQAYGKDNCVFLINLSSSLGGCLWSDGWCRHMYRIYVKRPIFVKRDPNSSKETHTHQKRPAHICMWYLSRDWNIIYVKRQENSWRIFRFFRLSRPRAPLQKFSLNIDNNSLHKMALVHLGQLDEI